MKFVHYVVIQQGWQLIPDRNESWIVYRTELDRQIHELLKKADGARLVSITGGNIIYYVDDDLYRQICALTLNKNDDKNER